jgi:arabinofuranan 3-O-arabinosyltransferase
LLALVAYVPLLFTKPHVLSADTKVYLYLDPGRLLRTALQMWDPQVGMGTVTHQTIGYLFPMGPYYWVMNAAGVPTWIAQRLWLGTVLFAAGAGVVYLLRTLRWRGPGVPAAAFVYMLSPYVLDYAAKHSVVALPWSGLPWLVAFTIRAVRHGGWRDAALVAITVQLIGGVNATSLVLVLVAVALWFPFAVWVHREASLRHAIAALGRIVLLTFITSLWWISGLYAQGRYGIDILRYTETAKTVASASSPSEVLRGLGYWFFYGKDKLGNFVQVGVPYTQELWLLAISFAIPALCMFAGGFARFRERAYFVSLVLVGTVLAVGAYPWTDPPLVGRILRWMLGLSEVGGAMRSMPRAVPVLVLGLAVLLGGALTALHERFSPDGIRFDRRVLGVASVVGLLALVNFPPLFTGQLIAKGLERPENIPQYWKDDIGALQAGSHATRVFEIPGSDFASYRWDGKAATTVDPITPGLMDRPYVAREQVPYGTPPSADLVTAFDTQLQEQILEPSALAPVARFMGVGVYNLRNDLTYERYRLARPRLLWSLVTNAPGLGEPQGFGANAPNVPNPSFPMLDETQLGAPPHCPDSPPALPSPTLYKVNGTSQACLPDPPPVAIVPVEDAVPIVRLAPTTSPVLMAGDGTGLVNASAAGLLSGHELLFESAGLAGKPKLMHQQLADGAVLLLTDTNRKQQMRWSTTADVYGFTEQAGEKPLVSDPSAQPLDVFPDAGDSARSVAVEQGGVDAQATDYGNLVTYTPEDRATNAIDGNPATAWQVGGFGPVEGERLELSFSQQQHTDHLRLLQTQRGAPNRWITEVKLTFDGKDAVTVPLDPSSRAGEGQTITFPEHSFSHLTVEITGDNIGKRPSYNDLSSVGIAELDVGDNPPHATELIRLPEDLLRAAGTSSLDHPLAVLLDRVRVSPSNTVRSDPEVRIARTFTLPTARHVGVSGQVRLSNTAPTSLIDTLVGIAPAAFGGVTASESRYLPGDLEARASAAIDGDPSTAWSPGMLGQVGDWVQYHLAAPLTFNHMDLTVVADARHSVPTRIGVEADGHHVADIAVPPVADSATPGAVTTVPLSFTAVTGSTLRFTVEAVRAVTTNDWYSEAPVDLPVGIAELGVPGLAAPAQHAMIDPACRGGLLSVDGHDVPISVHGTVADALAGRPLAFTSCVTATGVSLPKGDQTVLATNGATTGLDLDTIVLRSKAGGGADNSAGLVSPTSQGVEPGGAKVTVTHNGRSAVDMNITGANGPVWVVFGQSHDAGWHASSGGRDLGAPALVDGYANAWLVTPGADGTATVHLRWTPQRVVWIALALSALALLLCLALVLWPMRHRLAPVADEEGPAPIDRAPSVPRSFSVRRALRYAGAPPLLGRAALVTIGGGVVFGAIIGPIAGLVVAVCTALCLRISRARPLLTLLPPLLLASCGAYDVFFQLRHHVPTDFNWPQLLSRLDSVAWLSVALLVMDVLVDRLWLHRWWPTDDSPM